MRINLCASNSGKYFLSKLKIGGSAALMVLLTSLQMPRIHAAEGPFVPGDKAAAQRLQTAATLPSDPNGSNNETQAWAKTAFDKLSHSFIENCGQVDSRVSYYFSARDRTTYFTKQGLTFVLTDSDSATNMPAPPTAGSLQPAALRTTESATDREPSWVLKLDFVNADPNVRVFSEEPNATTISSFKGPRDQWKTGLKSYGKLTYSELWPGIDLVYTSSVEGLKYTFNVRPGADPNQIKLAYKGATQLKLNEAGQLEVRTPAGGFNDSKPYSYQGESVRTEVETAYSLDDTRRSDNVVYGFQVGAYDKSKSLTIDPALIYCGYIGGASSETGYGITLDDVGDVYLVGTVFSNEGTFPVIAGPDATQNGGADAFVAKVTADGTALVYCGYIGGSAEDQGYSIAVDSAGNAYVAGFTRSTQPSFPVTGTLDVTYNGGFWDGFVAKVNPTGTALSYCSFIGGNNEDQAYGIAVDGSGNAFVCGQTNSTFGFPQVVGPDLSYNGGGDAWVAKINPAGTGFVYCGYVGGSVGESLGWFNCMAIDAAGNAYIAGFTTSSQTAPVPFPALGGPDLTYNGGVSFGDVFVAKINPSGGGLVYCGYIGGSAEEHPAGIAVDSVGNLYVTGMTKSSEATFPVTVGPSLIYKGSAAFGGDGFIAKVKADGTGLSYCGYIGGTSDDECLDVAVDLTGNAFVTGFTVSDEATFPVTVGPDLSYNGGTRDAYVAKVNSSGALTYCGYIGGSGGEGGQAITIDTSGNAYVTGTTSSSQATFPVSVGPSVTFSGGSDIFLAKVAINPTASTLTDFTATGYANGSVLLEWQTGFEVDNLGFNVYREQGGERIKITPDVIAGSALVAGPGNALSSGQSYEWSDSTDGKHNAQYWLEAVDLNGRSSWHGPIAPRPTKETRDPSVDKRGVALMSTLGRDETKPESYEVPGVPQVDLADLSPARFQAQASLAKKAALKLSVSQEGWYRVTGLELATAGLDPNVDPRNLQLFAEGNEVPILVAGENDGKLDGGDTVEFYGTASASTSTNTRVYWLLAGSLPGQRVDRVKGKTSADKGGSFACTVERRDKTIYFAGLRNGDAENFFGPVVASIPVSQTVRALGVARSSDQATLEVSVQGVTHSLHHIGVNLNGTALGASAFQGQTRSTASFDIPQSSISEGDNTITLRTLTGERDVCLLDSIRLTYWRTYTAQGDSLKFSASSKQKLTIDGFSAPDIRVVDISDPAAPREVTGLVTPSGSGYQIATSAPKGGPRVLFAFTEKQIKKPVSITLNQPSSLRRGGQKAGLLIITRKEFTSAVEPLRSLRESQGLIVDTVDVDDIFDEFSFGEKSPRAIKEFLAFTASAWQRAPRFVLLIGDATFDPKNYLGFGDNDLVPTKLVDTDYMETASDDWFADFKGDGLAEMAIGRLPARTSQETSVMISKIISYDRSAKPDRVLLVSDSNDGFDFESANEQLKEFLGGAQVEDIRRGRLGTALAKSNLLAAIERGQSIICYTGHGNVNQWRGDLLTSGDARGLQNAQNPSIFVSMTCLNGYFQDPTLECLAESLVKAERGGAVAVWASSGMTDPGGQSVMNQVLFRQAFGSKSVSLGEAVAKAKAAVADLDVRRTWILFGDPSMSLR